ncbi:MAG: urate hydroxylase PuuD [Alphaproteobacteria bacterium]|tara:strand:+ start:37 stop:630 length:594 start_codon:yes stop_codon:yes gene_type:complete
MSNILSSLSKTVISGFILLIVIIFLISGITEFYFDYTFLTFLFRWLHVLSGVMWIGLLWYFNFVQIPSMPNIPDDQKPAISKVIAPKALFWFRWAALATLLTGLILAHLNGYLHNAMTLNTYDAKYFMIGIGMWLGIIMAFNVWVIIWPNQKKALGIITVDAKEKASAARKAMLFSRTNTLLSIPMLYCMVGAQNLY